MRVSSKPITRYTSYEIPDDSVYDDKCPLEDSYVHLTKYRLLAMTRIVPLTIRIGDLSADLQKN